MFYSRPSFWAGLGDLVILRKDLDPNRYWVVGLTQDRPFVSAALRRAIRAAEEGDGGTALAELEFVAAICRSVALLAAEYLFMRVRCKLAIFSKRGRPIGLASELSDGPESPAAEEPYPEDRVIHIGDAIAFYEDGCIVRPVALKE